MKDIIREVTVYRHKLFGEIRTVEDDEGYKLVILADLSACLKKKNIIKATIRHNIEIIDVNVECLTAVKDNVPYTEIRRIGAIKIKDALHLIRTSQISSSRVLEMWFRRDILRDESMWSSEISFNREYYKDEYIELQISELDLLKAKISILEADILEVVEPTYYSDVISEKEVNNTTLKNAKKVSNVKYYYNPLFGEVGVIKRDKEILFVANDIAKCLKYKASQMAVKTYCSKLEKVAINSEMYQSTIGAYAWHKVVVNAIAYPDVERLMKGASKVNKRVFELWLRKEVLGEDIEYDKNTLYQGEFYKDEYIKVLAKEIDLYRKNIELLEKELYDRTERVEQEDWGLVTNYDVAKMLESKFKVTKK